MAKKFRTVFLRVAVSILSLVFVFYTVRGEVAEAISHLTDINLLFLLIAVILNFISLIVVTLRIGMILSIQQINLPFFRLYYLWVIGLFFNLFLPSAVGGDIAKAYYIYKDSGKKMASVTAVLFDRFFGLVATISIGFFAFLFGREHINDPKFGQLLFGVVGIVLIGVLFMTSRRFSKPFKSLLLALSPARFHARLLRFFEALELYQSRRMDFCIIYLYSLAAQGLFIAVVYFLARSIHLDLPFGIFLLLLPLVTIISMVPSIGGLGVREAATVYLFRSYISLDGAVAISLVFDLFLYGIGCVCGILYAIRGGAPIREFERMENGSSP